MLNIVRMMGTTALVTALIGLGFAKADFIANGDFSQPINIIPGTQYAGSTLGGQMGMNVNVNNWETTGYNFIFTPKVADTVGVNSRWGDLKLWGPGDGSGNGFTGASPTGGNFLAADGAYETGPISQTIKGLVKGNQYQVGFWWAGAQQYTFDGANTEQWHVSLGDETHSTAVYNNTSHGFGSANPTPGANGWEWQTFNFTATKSLPVR